MLCNCLFIKALQNLLFCVPKAAVLHGKSVGFALQKSRFRSAKSKLAFFLQIIFTKPKRFLYILLEILGILENLKSLEQLFPQPSRTPTARALPTTFRTPPNAAFLCYFLRKAQ